MGHDSYNTCITELRLIWQNGRHWRRWFLCCYGGSGGSDIDLFLMAEIKVVASNGVSDHEREKGIIEHLWKHIIERRVHGVLCFSQFLFIYKTGP